MTHSPQASPVDAGDVLVVVPARGGSKRLPGKNIKQLAGIPLIAHTARFIAAEGLLDRAVLSTDSEEIRQAAGEFGLAAPFMRPAELATDSATTGAVIRHALEWELAATGRMSTLVAVLQPTSPIRRPGILREGIARLASTPDLNSVIGMYRLHVKTNFVFKRDRDLQPVTSEILPAFVPTGSIYVTRSAALYSSLSVYNRPIDLIEMSAEEAVDIDELPDFTLAEYLLTCNRTSAERQNGGQTTHPAPPTIAGPSVTQRELHR